VVPRLNSYWQYVEQLWLFVTPEAGVTLDEDRVIAVCRDQLASFKVPKRVVTRDTMPTTRIGKIDRKRLESEARELAKGMVEES
jgi:acyl-CoA synthetase (AMP-forming)/AMP-acid ligase II